MPCTSSQLVSYNLTLTSYELLKYKVRYVVPVFAMSCSCSRPNASFSLEISVLDRLRMNWAYLLSLGLLFVIRQFFNVILVKAI